MKTNPIEPKRRILVKPPEGFRSSQPTTPGKKSFEPRKFELDACLQKLESQKSQIMMTAAGLDPSLPVRGFSREEAYFWFLVDEGIYEAYQAYSLEYAANAQRQSSILSQLQPGGTVHPGAMSAQMQQAHKMQEPHAVYTKKMDELLDRLRNTDFSAIPQDLRPRSRTAVQYAEPWILPLFTLIPLLDVLACLPRTFSVAAIAALIPTLEEGERHQLTSYVKQEISEIDHESIALAWQTGWHNQKLPSCYELAGMLDMQDELRNIVSRWKPEIFNQIIQGRGNISWKSFYPQYTVCLIDDALLVEKEMRRLELRPKDDLQCAALICATETRCLDLIVDEILTKIHSWEHTYASAMYSVLEKVETLETVRHILKIYAKQKKLQPRARKWLERFPFWTVSELLALAQDETEDLSGVAKTFLSDFRHLVSEQQIGEESMQKLENQFGSTIGNSATAVVLPDPDNSQGESCSTDQSGPEWLTSSFHGMTKKWDVAWAPAKALPSPVVDDFRLRPDQTESILTALRESTFLKPHPLIKNIKQNADGKTSQFHPFVWDLFERWLREGAPAKEKWAMMAIGFLGSDESALALTPSIRKWPGENQHARAVLGLECLREIGTDTALTCIHGIAEKVKFKGLKTSADECLKNIARKRGLSRPELEDRIIPDFGLDNNGKRVFNFGPRQFELIIGSDCTIRIKDHQNNLRPDLPKPNAKDDPEKSSAALQAWKTLKSQLAAAAQTQALRLEQAMVTGRRWKRSDFERFLLNHPLMSNFVRALVWQAYSETGETMWTFRVSEDNLYTNVEDREVASEKVGFVSIAHPLAFDDSNREAWQQVLADYRLMPPFAQLSRPTFKLDQSENLATKLDRISDIAVPALSMISILERSGWLRGGVGDNGSVMNYYKHFPALNTTAIVLFDPGYSIGMMQEAEDQTVGGCFFIQGEVDSRSYYWSEPQEAMTLRDISPAMISEVITDMQKVATKASASNPVTSQQTSGASQQAPQTSSAAIADRSRLQRGEYLLDQQRYAEALELAEQLTTSDPGNMDFWELKADALLYLGRSDEAIEAYNKFSPDSVNEKNIWMYKGVALYQKGLYDKAVEAYDKALSTSPSSACYFNKILALKQNRNHQEALACCEQAIQFAHNRSPNRFPDMSLQQLRENYFASGRNEDMSNEIGARCRSMERLSSAWHIKGIVLFDLACYEEAIQAFEEAVKAGTDIYDREHDHWSWLAASAANLKRYDYAIECYEKSYSDEARKKKLHYELQLKRFEKALESATRLVHQDRQDNESWCSKGEALRGLNRFKDALKCYDKAISIAPKETSGWHGRAMTLHDLGNHQEALDSCDEMIRETDDKLSGWNLKGYLFAVLQKNTEALVCFNNAIEVHPEIGVAWHNKACSLLAMKRFEEAIEAVDKDLESTSPLKESLVVKAVALECLNQEYQAREIIRESPKSFESVADFEHCLGSTKLSAGAPAQALQHLNTAVESDPEDAEKWYTRGCCYSMLGRYKEARTDLAQACKLNKKFKTTAECEPYLEGLRQAQSK